jgi:hypothetical protein
MSIVSVVQVVQAQQVHRTVSSQLPMVRWQDKLCRFCKKRSNLCPLSFASLRPPAVVAAVDSDPEAVVEATVVVAAVVATEAVDLQDQTSLLLVVAVAVEAMVGAVGAMEVGTEGIREENPLLLLCLFF